MGIRIHDLRTPELTEAQQEMLAAARAHPVEMTVDSVLTAAREQTGLTDFGDMKFTDRLERWLSEVRDDPNRTEVSRANLRRTCVRLAATRLRVVDLLHRHPEIHDEPIAQPVIVVGLPRSGTTHLVNVLASDPRFRSLPLWEAWEPIADPNCVDDIDPRYARAQAQWEILQQRSPLMVAMHPMNPDHVHEELELESVDFSSYNLEWLVQYAPRWRDHYLATDQTPHYAFLRTMLQVLQWQDRHYPRDAHGRRATPRSEPRRWLLKCPQHLEQLGPLMATFPDATVVMTHRDPVSVVQSAATMVGYGARTAVRDFDLDVIFEYWADRIARLLDAATEGLPHLPEQQRIDLHFQDFMADEAGSVEKILDRIGWQTTAADAVRIREFLAAHPRDRGGRVSYDLRADFHIEPAALRQRYQHYIDQFDVAEEVQ